MPTQGPPLSLVDTEGTSIDQHNLYRGNRCHLTGLRVGRELVRSVYQPDLGEYILVCIAMEGQTGSSGRGAAHQSRRCDTLRS